jgi:uncharacterized membrane protein YfhO
VPGAARFSVLPAPGGTDPGRVLSVRGSASDGFTIRTRATTSGVLVLRVTSVPGWHAAVDGRAVATEKYDDVMLSVALPPGSHTVTLHYLPDRLVLATALALATVVAAIVGAGVVWFRRRRRSAESVPVIEG